MLQKGLKILIILMISILLSLNLINCTKTITIYRPMEIDLPPRPELQQVNFKEIQQGILLDKENARKLLLREILIWTYLEQLESRIEINNFEARRQVNNGR